MISIISECGLWIGGSGMAFTTLAQQVPGVPDDFKDWRFPTLCAFIVIVSLFLKAWETNKMSKTVMTISKLNADAMERLGERVSTIATSSAVSLEQENERGRRADEMNSKLGTLTKELSVTNERMSGISVNLDKRPCLKGTKNETHSR